jgi:hypothetical protein
MKTWSKWKLLIGTWEGEGNGKPGQGSGYFTFNLDLDSNLLVRKNHSEYPAMNGKPAFSHDDLLIVYPDTSGTPVKAIYFDNEGHIINYLISYSDSAIILTSIKETKSYRFRLSYRLEDPKKVKIKFEMAAPENTEKFSTYLEGTAIKKD